METYVYLDESGRKTASGTIRMTEATYQLGLRIKEIIDELISNQIKNNNKGEISSLIINQVEKIIDKKCFYELMKKKKWWNTSPIYNEYTDDGNNRPLRDIMADYSE